MTEPHVFSEFMELLWASQQFYFAIDAVTSARTAINRPHIFQMERLDDPAQTVTREEAREAFHRWHEARFAGEPDPFPPNLTTEELELYTQIARGYTQRHFIVTNAVDVRFEHAEPIEFCRDETGAIVATDFLLSFTVFDETGRTVAIHIFRNAERFHALWAWS